MFVKINCVDNDKGAWCENKNIRKSMWGIGARCCIEYENRDEKCLFKVSVKKSTQN